MSWKQKYNRVLIAIDAYFKGHKKTIENNKKTVLIVFQQIFGDSIVIQDSLKAYVKLYSPEEGYQIKFLARPSVISFMKNTLVLPEEIEMEDVDFKRFLEDYSYYKEITKKYMGIASILIVPGTSLSAEIFSAANDAKRKIGLTRSIKLTKPLIMALFSRIAYTDFVQPLKEDMMLQRHRLLLNYLGETDYKAKLPSLLPKEKIIKENHYCVMCPGSSKLEKCWPTCRFSEVADYIIEKYDMNIHLCGGADETEFEKNMLIQTKHLERIISHIGKTNFSDWSAIVQHADLVVGNDSATMHLAAASRRRAICIAGVYDKYQFFPYKVDFLEEGDCLPITLLKDMPCEWCRTKGYHAGFGNKECKRRIASNQCASCIDLITVEDVEEQIDMLMR